MEDQTAENVNDQKLNKHQNKGQPGERTKVNRRIDLAGEEKHA